MTTSKTVLNSRWDASRLSTLPRTCKHTYDVVVQQCGRSQDKKALDSSLLSLFTSDAKDGDRRLKGRQYLMGFLWHIFGERDGYDDGDGDGDGDGYDDCYVTRRALRDDVFAASTFVHGDAIAKIREQNMKTVADHIKLKTEHAAMANIVLAAYVLTVPNEKDVLLRQVVSKRLMDDACPYYLDGDAIAHICNIASDVVLPSPMPPPPPQKPKRHAKPPPSTVTLTDAQRDVLNAALTAKRTFAEDVGAWYERMQKRAVELDDEFNEIRARVERRVRRAINNHPDAHDAIVANIKQEMDTMMDDINTMKTCAGGVNSMFNTLKILHEPLQRVIHTHFQESFIVQSASGGGDADDAD